MKTDMHYRVTWTDEGIKRLKHEMFEPSKIWYLFDRMGTDGAVDYKSQLSKAKDFHTTQEKFRKINCDKHGLEYIPTEFSEEKFRMSWLEERSKLLDDVLKTHKRVSQNFEAVLSRLSKAYNYENDNLLEAYFKALDLYYKTHSS